MRVRLIVSAVLCFCALYSSGCCHNSVDVGQTPPPFKVCNLSRLGVELGWFYADLQDVLFGVTYYEFNEEKFPSVVYR